MDISAATAVKATADSTVYKPAKPAEQNDFNKIFDEVSVSDKKQALRPERTKKKSESAVLNKDSKKPQENYDSVLSLGNMNYTQIKMNDYAQSVSEAEELVMGVSEVQDTGIQIAFADITDAFADMIATEFLSQYITKNYPLGTGGKNPKEEFSEKVSDIMFNAMEDHSGFTKTQMTNPNMTVDVMGLNDFVNDDFIQEITDDIISVVFRGDINDKNLMNQTVKNAVENIMLNPKAVISTVTDASKPDISYQNAALPEASSENSIQPNEAPAAPLQNAVQTAEAAPVQQEITAAPAEAPRMILMSDGTYIPETAIMKSTNMPDEKGIYPAGTEYIEATPLIGKGSSPATAVLLAKVGDDDGLVRPSDFVKARNIVFTKHENVYGRSAASVYMPINAADENVSGIIEYNGSENSFMDTQSDDNGKSEFMNFSEKDKNEMPSVNADITANNAVQTAHIAEPHRTAEVFRVPEKAAETAITQMTQRVTNELIRSGTDSVKQMQIQLQPETLGNILIKLESVRGEVNVKIIATNPEVRDMIAQTAAQMSDSIRAQGVNLNNINVSSAAQQQENFDGSSGNAAYYSGSQQQNQGRQQEENENYRDYMEAAENEKIRRVIDSIRSMGM